MTFLLKLFGLPSDASFGVAPNRESAIKYIVHNGQLTWFLSKNKLKKRL